MQFHSLCCAFIKDVVGAVCLSSRMWNPVQSTVSWTFRPSEPLFTALPRFPLFFPHDLVFNMDAEKPPLHTAVYVAAEHIQPRPMANGGSGCTVSIDRRLMLKLTYLFWATSRRIFSQKPETIRKRTRNGVCQGPGKLNNSIIRLSASSRLTNRRGSCDPSSQSQRLSCDGQRCHTCSRCVDIAERFLHCCMVVEQEELLEIFRGQYINWFLPSMHYSHPQPCLGEGVTGCGGESNEGRRILFQHQIKMTCSESKRLCYH